MDTLEKRLKRLRWGLGQIIHGDSSINEDFKAFALMLVDDDDKAAALKASGRAPTKGE